MIKRFILVFLTILYLGISATAGISCQLWMGPTAANHMMASGHQDCAGMANKQKPEKDCCKQACQELKATESAASHFTHELPASLPAVLPRILFFQAPLRFFSGDKIAATQPPPVGRSIPVFLQVRNFRI